METPSDLSNDECSLGTVDSQCQNRPSSDAQPNPIQPNVSRMTLRELSSMIFNPSSDEELIKSTVDEILQDRRRMFDLQHDRLKELSSQPPSQDDAEAYRIRARQISEAIGTVAGLVIEVALISSYKRKRMQAAVGEKSKEDE